MMSKFNTAVTCIAVLLSIQFVASTSFACDGDKKKKKKDETYQGSQQCEEKPKNAAEHKGVPPVGTMAVCPVTKEKFNVVEDTQHSVYKGKTYVFCCAGCKPQFDKNPDKYI